jgi:hypothetical protein
MELHADPVIVFGTARHAGQHLARDFGRLLRPCFQCSGGSADRDLDGGAPRCRTRRYFFRSGSGQQPFPERFRSRWIMLKEALDHMDDCRGSTRRYSLADAPSVDPLDQLGFDPDVDVCGFSFHAGEVGRCRACPLDNPGQRFDRSAAAVRTRNQPMYGRSARWAQG